MGELSERLEQARGAVRVAWTDERARNGRAGVAARLRSRARRRAAAGATALAAAVVAGVGVLLARPWSSPRGAAELHARAPTTGAAAARAVRLADGSTATPLDPRAELVVVEATAERATLRLVRGAARFDVAHVPGRTFRVEAGAVSVQVLGTVFTVARDERGAGARVAVEAGRVRAFFGAHYADLGAGEAGVFPRAAGAQLAAEGDGRATAEGPGASARDDDAPRAVAAAAPAGASSAPTPSAPPSWRALAERGQFDEAYRALQRARAAVRDEPGELLLASDVARLSGHPAAAVTALEQLVARHASDARAPLAAFTLGRVLLDELGRPREAAAAFGRARALDRHGSVAEDALAREVEAHWRANDAASARAAAERYVAAYPSGLALRRVRRFGGLE